MKKIQKISIILMILFGVVSGYAQTNRSFKVIVNKENSVTKLSKADISKMLLKKVSKWEDGQKVLPIDQKADSRVRKNFSKVIHKKSVVAILAYWQKKIFTGKGVPPVEKRTNNDVIKFVKDNPGAIGYVSNNTKVTGVEVIEVTD